CARAEADRTTGAGSRAPPRARRADGARRTAARAPARGGSRARRPSTGGPASGAGEHRHGLGQSSRGGCAMVTDSRGARAVRGAGVGDVEFDGTPRQVNRQPVALVREEWRVVDRWWTEEPVSRRYFDVVLQSGENAVVFRDEERGCWFTQRGA